MKVEQFTTGAVRDTAENKPRVDLFSIPLYRDILFDQGDEEARILFTYWVCTKDQLTKANLLQVYRQACIAEDITIFDGIWITSMHLATGAKVYAERNWEKGMPISRVIQSADRHLLQWIAGEKEENHLAAFLCNVMFLYHYLEMIDFGYLPKELNDWEK